MDREAANHKQQLIAEWKDHYIFLFNEKQFALYVVETCSVETVKLKYC